MTFLFLFIKKVIGMGADSLLIGAPDQCVVDEAHIRLSLATAGVTPGICRVHLLASGRAAGVEARACSLCPTVLRKGNPRSRCSVMMSWQQP
jgi:hypothetical protein